jgi:hypothetical protein
MQECKKRERDKMRKRVGERRTGERKRLIAEETVLLYDVVMPYLFNFPLKINLRVKL